MELSDDEYEKFVELIGQFEEKLDEEEIFARSFMKDGFKKFKDWLDEEYSHNICDTCGFPKDAQRDIVLMKSSTVAFAQHMSRQCPECEHYQDGSTIKDEVIRRKFGGPPKVLNQGGWKAEIQEGRKYEYDGDIIEVVDERTQTEEKGNSVVFTRGDGTREIMNLYGFEGKLASGKIEPVKKWELVRSTPTVKEARGPVEEKVEIDTREGTVVADEGDYIIEESDGNRYPISSEKFEKFYKVVDRG